MTIRMVHISLPLESRPQNLRDLSHNLVAFVALVYISESPVVVPTSAVSIKYQVSTSLRTDAIG